MLNTKDKSYQNQVNLPVLCHIPAGPKMILDIGCGAGTNAKYLKSFGHIIDGVTLSEEEKKSASPFMRNIYIYNLENGLPNITEKYDVVFCSHVLEHIAYPQRLLQDIRSVLNENGILIVAVPNIMHYKSRFEIIKGNFPMHDSGIWDNTHLRWYTLESGKHLLETNGFVGIEEYIDGDLPLLTVLGVIPQSIRKKIFKVLTKISKGLFSSQLIYVAK